ncbi:MAG: SMP-30/gluconolactonase/LRE family protein [Bacteroidales bacterium]|nr:SMP-30/gluconolactonase/LRE family protein [Bacteroidales bacterium]
MNVELLIASNDLLGEGPVWDSSRKELLWVDIEQRQLHIYHLPSGIKTDFQFDSLLSVVVPVRNSDKYLLAFQKGIALFDRMTNDLQYLADPEKHTHGNRFNDGKCDPQGRFWVGSMNCGAAPGKGSLYRLDQNLRVTKMLSREASPMDLPGTKIKASCITSIR